MTDEDKPAATDRRLWQYRKGEARVFDCPGAVPPGEGWQEFPLTESQISESDRQNALHNQGVQAGQSSNAFGSQNGEAYGSGQASKNQTGEDLAPKINAIADRLAANGKTLGSIAKRGKR